MVQVLCGAVHPNTCHAHTGHVWSHDTHIPAMSSVGLAGGEEGTLWATDGGVIEMVPVSGMGG